MARSLQVLFTYTEERGGYEIMRKLWIVIAVCALTLSVLGAAHAGSYELKPNPVDLWELDHHYYYSWGINWSIPTGEKIVDATLSISHIDDWTNEANDALYIHLLDNPNSGTNKFYDAESYGDNRGDPSLNTQGITGPMIDTYSDHTAGSENLSYSLKDLGLLNTLNAYIASAPSSGKANFGFGFDPDCHYDNCGVKLCIQTAPVPEPSSILVLIGELGSALSMIRFRRR